jgi:hypothetical protein
MGDNIGCGDITMGSLSEGSCTAAEGVCIYCPRPFKGKDAGMTTMGSRKPGKPGVT